MKCFNCNEFGHKYPECKKEKTKKERKRRGINEDRINLNTTRNMYKTIEIQNKKMNALI